jgi:hypothetical protein
MTPLASSAKPQGMIEDGVLRKVNERQKWSTTASTLVRVGNRCGSSVRSLGG